MATKWKWIAGLGVSGIAMAAAGQAMAQQAESDTQSGLVLEEIVVTADRKDSYSADFVQAGSFRGARQIDTPLTVSVISEQVLKSQQAQSILDALRNSPGVTSSQTSPTVYNNLSIRGIPVENRGNYRLNGSLPIVNLIDLPLENKVRVEALKGASALYYGFTTPSGIINLTTKRPTLDPVLSVAVNGNDHGQVQGHIDAGGTWGILGVRGNLVYGTVDSGIDNTWGRRSFQSGAFQLTPSDSLQINLDVEHISKEVTEPTVIQGRTAAASLMTVVPDLPRASNNPGSKGFMNRADATNVLGRVSWKITPAWNLVAEGGISYVERDRRFSRLANFDPVTGNGVLTMGAADGQLYRNKNGRIELAGTFATGPVIHELMIGASKNIRRQYSPLTVSYLAGGAGSNANCIAIGLAAGCVQNLYNPVDLNDIRYSGGSPYNPTRDTSIKDTGFYAFDRMRFGGANDDMFSVLLGIRKSIYKETRETVAGPSEETFSDKPISLSGGLVFKPKEWISTYATYIEGLESTPGAPLTTNNAGEILPASNSKQYEGGIKIEPQKGLLFTAAYFDISRQLTYTNAANFFVKDGKATYRGLEFSLTGEVTPDLSIYGSALFLRAKQGETADTALIGNRIENTAKTQWSISGEYRLTQLVEGLAVSAGAYYTGARAINPQNSLFLPGYTLFDLGGSYAFEIGGVGMTARVNAQNITGKKYFASTSSNYIAFGAPSVIKFSLTANIF
ncbi:TonB-dependent siderophore receptor [uncultured Sphingosinicella sp.]|uniref:TonB-dependent siderophore receptor n=1 Tax=uncultured Sphingosinicella sp. TaxID=478748 RepID=UPI0030DCF205|tara:strand:+ start:1401 stop:3602 length:2202 start_codon:yes stop_codon:yes gene_type:complete